MKKLKRSNTEKGITLIALIITVVVLLILAVVAINSIQNDGILEHAQNAAGTYNQAVKNEQSMLQEYEDYLTGINGGFEVYDAGDEVTIGTESFYVIKDSSNKESKVLLITKEYIDTSDLVQSESANPVAFSATRYWVDEAGNVSSEYKRNTKVVYFDWEPDTPVTYEWCELTETGIPDSTHYAAYAAYQYGKKIGGAGRLLTYDEAMSYDLQDGRYWIPDGWYWIGSVLPDRR